jgi:MFS family permease
MRSFWRYENGLLAILTLSLGFTIFDRVALNLLAPYILTDLHMNNTDLGLMASALSVTLALSGYFFGTHADRARNRKGVLFVAVLLFSLLSAVSGLAVSLMTMIAARLLMGLTEGPILPISYGVLAIESSERRRALNMGIFANFATCLIAGVVGPIVLTHVADAFGWRAAFFLTGVPGLFVALLIFRFVREPEHPMTAEPVGHPKLRLGERNVWLCLLLTCALYTWLLVTLIFTPVFLVRFVGMPPTEMGFISAINGVAGCTLAIGTSWLADRIGRKPTVIMFLLVGLLVPAGELWAHHSIPAMSLLMFLGWSGIGVSPLIAGTIPSETVGPATVARTLAVIIGVAEIIGGVVMPVIAGWAADRWGLEAPMWIVLAVTACGVVGACFLRETLPSKVGVSAFTAPDLATDLDQAA